jgi:hypothetical protein
MSISFWDGDSLDKNWENLKEAVNFMQHKTNVEIAKLKSQLEIKSIERFESLFLEGVKVSTWESSGWYSNKYIRIDFTSQCNDFLKTKCHDGEICWGSAFKKFSINEDGLKLAKEFIDELAEYDKEKHENNIIKNQSNNETYTSLMNLLKRIGISDTYYGYKSNRSSKKESLHYSWNSEISGQIPRGYSTNTVYDLIKRHKESIQKIYDTEMKKIADEAKKKEEEKKTKEQNKKLALLLAKYDLDLNCEWSDLLDAVVEKNKYLRLGYYLEKNRNDWNEGYSYAETGLNGFNTETELDQEIYEDIQSCIDNWDHDGRVFRDCKYCYSELYGIASEQAPDIYKDFEVIRENVSDF